MSDHDDVKGGRRAVVGRALVGRPRLWQGIAWILIGLAWLALAVIEGSAVWRWTLGGLWTVLGIVILTVAIADRRHGRGRYADSTNERVG